MLLSGSTCDIPKELQLFVATELTKLLELPESTPAETSEKARAIARLGRKLSRLASQATFLSVKCLNISDEIADKAAGGANEKSVTDSAWRDTFVGRVLAGTAQVDDIKQYIGDWTRAGSNVALHEFLGFTSDQCLEYADDPSTLLYVFQDIERSRGRLDTLCGRCFEPAEVFRYNCYADPLKSDLDHNTEYDCPDCGATVHAGKPHPPLCQTCLERTHETFDNF